jgi:hypothetical protein
MGKKRAARKQAVLADEKLRDRAYEKELDAPAR